MNEESLFAAVLEQLPADRQRYLKDVCGDDAALLKRMCFLLAAHAKAAGILELSDPPKDPVSDTADDPFTEKVVQSSLVDLNCWNKSAKAAWARFGWPSKREPVRRKVALKLIKAGMDYEGGLVALRGRAASPGPDGSSQHRQGARRRHDRSRAALFHHGVRQRHSDHQILRQRAPEHRRASELVCPSLPGRAARPPERHHSPGPQTFKYSGVPLRWPARAQSDRFRPGQSDAPASDRTYATHRPWPIDWHPALHEPRTGGD